MIIRIVQMHFEPAKVPEFVALFEERKATIRSFPGCQHLELWQHNTDKSTYYTYSIWESEQHLDHYRFSEFFKDTWGKTKALFAGKPMAWSVNRQSVAQ